jgi:hypothetical protein
MNVVAVPEAERPERATARQARVFLIIAVALLLLKLLWVSQREMVPEQHDAEAYASASMQDLSALFTVGAGHAPGASLVMAVARWLGIPYRIFIEGFLATAAFLFLRPLIVPTRIGIAAATLIYSVLLFHPALILEMDRSMSDSVSFFCWLIGAGGIVGFVAAPREKLPYWSLGLVIAGFAFAGITRTGEGLIVLIEMAAIALLSLFLFRGADSWRRRRATVACLCAVVASLAATQALSAAHYLRNGYWGASAVESREWWRLYGTLLSLPVERTDRNVLVNKATMNMAESLSEDLQNMDPCFRQVEAEFSQEETPNYGTPWVFTGCLPGEDSAKHYERMRAISADILNNARDRHIDLLPPVLGIIPQPALQWLPYLPASVEEVALQAVELPDTTRVAQNSWQEALFDRALLRRTALVATGANPEVFGYNSFVRILYTVLATIFWPSVPIVLPAVAIIAIHPARNAVASNVIVFFISLTLIDVLCRISFYSIVDWILWEIPFRYILGPSVLTVVIVTTLLSAWAAPALGIALRSRMTKLPGLWSWAEIGERPNPRA